MDLYDILKKVTNSALLLLGIALALAAIDHLYFDEAYRSAISVIGIFALLIFFTGIVAAVIKSALDKSKNDG